MDQQEIFKQALRDVAIVRGGSHDGAEKRRSIVSERRQTVYRNGDG